MRFRRLAITAAVLLITALGYVVYPGHTWLQQDSQIYVPILEHLWDPGVLAHDPVATHPHVSLTVYDELALAARRLTGADFHTILAADQLVFRAVGILGVYLIASAMGLSAPLALLAAAAYALGASVDGPAVLTVEYEPKPRGSATAMVFLGLGLIAHGRHAAAGVAGAAAFLYHPPTVYPFWAVYAVWAAWPGGGSEGRRKLRGFLPLVIAGAGLLVLSHVQPGGAEPQSWFARLSPEVEQIQRVRSSYNWVSAWYGERITHYVVLWLVSVAATLRLRRLMPEGLRVFAVGMPLVGMLSVPASYLLLEVWKWALMAKFQPARALLFVSASAVILALCACLDAARRRGIAEAAIWGVLAFAVPVQHRVQELLLPDLGDALIRRRVVLVVVLAILAVAAGRFSGARARLAWPAWLAALVVPFFAIPNFGKVVTEANMHHAELDEVAAWARAHTAPDAVFLFPDVGKGRQPGIFRAGALRAIYVDWKAGGQANMVEGFAQEWWRRWNEAMAAGFSAADMERYRPLGIDYVVVQTQNRLPERRPVFENAKYLVYPVGPASVGEFGD